MYKGKRSDLTIPRVILCIALCACSACLLVACQASRDPPPPLNRVAAWLPTSWDGDRARASWQAHRVHIHEISPVWYQIAPGGDGSIHGYPGVREATLVEEAHAQDTLVIPLINNAYADVGFDPGPVSRVIHDPARRSAHVNALVNEVLTYGYDGIDIDYESLNGKYDRDAFSIFVRQLAEALHAHNRLLSVTVHPKTSEPGDWDGPAAQDWATIGAAVDRFRVMTYGYHWSMGDPGPIAPRWWIEDVLAFATSVVPPNRVYMGLHFYGHDWSAPSSGSVVWEEAQALIKAHGAVPQWQDTDAWGRVVAEPWFSYTDGFGEPHEVWYSDAASIAARLELVQRYGLGGIAIWRLGGEDPANWETITTTLCPPIQSSHLPLDRRERVDTARTCEQDESMLR